MMQFPFLGGSGLDWLAALSKAASQQVKAEKTLVAAVLSRSRPLPGEITALNTKAVAAGEKSEEAAEERLRIDAIELPEGNALTVPTKHDKVGGVRQFGVAGCPNPFPL